MSVNHYERAFKIWKVLTDFAKEHKKITYKEISEITKVHWRAQYIPLGFIQDYCLENDLPPLSILAVNNTTKSPGSGFIACSTNKIISEQERVFEFNWEQLENPFAFSLDADINKILTSIKNFELNNENVVKIKARGILQSLLKDASLSIYNNQCAMCQTTIEDLLEACHIKPYSDCDENERKDLRNIILLCKNHHKLFDSGLIRIDENYKMHISSDVTLKSSADKEIFKHIDNVMIILPGDVKYYPNKEYIRYLNNR